MEGVESETGEEDEKRMKQQGRHEKIMNQETKESNEVESSNEVCTRDTCYDESKNSIPKIVTKKLSEEGLAKKKESISDILKEKNPDMKTIMHMIKEKRREKMEGKVRLGVVK